ncbi:MAG: cyclase family protein [Bdellovibrionaceae bacterium]|nr:cyclase family protein [Pseudobdellovibrionaceae bacterium]
MNLDQRKIYDITPTVSTELAVFPGDTRYENSFLMSFDQGHHLSLSAMKSTVHIGAHADAPSHYHAQGDSIEKRDLSLYLGKAQVITVSRQARQRIRPGDFTVKIQAPRVLFKTGSFPNPHHWNDDFMALSIELIQFLTAAGVQLVGIDTPSVDLADDKILEVHHEIHRSNLAILEGLVLESVADGLYDLVALPLKLKGAEASPVRAVLLGG